MALSAGVPLLGLPDGRLEHLAATELALRDEVGETETVILYVLVEHGLNLSRVARF